MTARKPHQILRKKNRKTHKGATRARKRYNSKIPPENPESEAKRELQETKEQPGEQPMTSYNTCAYPGCLCRIQYEPGFAPPPKYYPAHQQMMDSRVHKEKDAKQQFWGQGQ